MEMELPPGFEIAVLKVAFDEMREMTASGGSFTSSDGLATFTYNLEDREWYQQVGDREPSRVGMPVAFGYFVLQVAVQIGTRTKESGVGGNLNTIADAITRLESGEELSPDEMSTVLEAVKKSAELTGMPLPPVFQNLVDLQSETSDFIEKIKSQNQDLTIARGKIDTDTPFQYAMGADHPEGKAIDGNNPDPRVLERVLEGIDARLAGREIPEYCIEYGEVPPRDVLLKIRADLYSKYIRAKQRNQPGWDAPPGFNPEHN